LSVPSSNVLVVSAQSALLLRANLVAFFAMMFLLVLILPGSFNGWVTMVLLLVGNIIIGVLRYLYLVNIFRRQYLLR